MHFQQFAFQPWCERSSLPCNAVVPYKANFLNRYGILKYFSFMSLFAIFSMVMKDFEVIVVNSMCCKIH